MLDGGVSNMNTHDHVIKSLGVVVFDDQGLLLADFGVSTRQPPLIPPSLSPISLTHWQRNSPKFRDRLFVQLLRVFIPSTCLRKERLPGRLHRRIEPGLR